MLFHTLYQLKDQCWRDSGATLQISPLNIMLFKGSDNESQELAEFDALSEYYLDLDNLKNTSERDVSDLLETFWRTLGRHDKR